MKRLGWVLALASLWAASNASALDLAEAYRAAVANDADFAIAAAERDAGQEEENKALAGLLPNVSFNGSQSQNTTEQRSLTAAGMRTANYNYDANSLSINLRQPLYRPYQWAAYAQGQAQARYSDLLFAAAKQDMILRVAGAYLDTLLAKDTVALAQAQKQAYGEQLAQAKRLFSAGEGTVTDINEAQARYDSALAQELETANNLEVARRSLERLTGQEPTELRVLMTDKPVPQSPEPNDVKQWVEWARLNNPVVQANREGQDISQQEIAKAGAEHKPTLDLVASRTKSDSENNVSINTRYDTTAVGVQLTIPLYGGGRASASIRQAEAGKRKAEQQLESALRKAMLDARQQFLNVTTNVAQINAYRQAVVSNEAALVSTRKSFTAGIRTSVDILNAQQQVFSAKRDLARARYTYISSWLKLKAAAGSLNEEDVVHINSWLVADAHPGASH